MTPSSSCDDVSCDSLRSLMGARHRARLCTDSTSSLSARATRYGQEQERMRGDFCAASAQNAQRSSLRSERLVQSRACHARDPGVSCARPLDVREARSQSARSQSALERRPSWLPATPTKTSYDKAGTSDEPVTDARNGRKRRAGECVRIYRARATHRLRRSCLMILWL